MLGKRQIAALRAAPEIHPEEAAAYWLRSGGSGIMKEGSGSGCAAPERAEPPEGEAFIALLAGVSSSSHERMYAAYPGWSFHDRIRDAAPVVTVRAGSSNNRRYKVIIVDGRVVLRLKRRSSRGIVMAAPPPVDSLPPYFENVIKAEVNPSRSCVWLRFRPEEIPHGYSQYSPPPTDGQAEKLVRKMQAEYDALARRGVSPPRPFMTVRVPGEEAGSRSENGGTGGNRRYPGPENHPACELPGGWPAARSALGVIGGGHLAFPAAPPGADSSEADLSGCSIKSARYARMSFYATILERTEFRSCDLRECDLRRTRVSEAKLRGCDLGGADLRRSVLPGAEIQNCRLTGANLEGLVLSRLHLNGCDLREANLRETSWGSERKKNLDMRGADLLGADLRGVTLLRCDLREVKNLSDTRLQGASLAGCKMDRENVVLASLLGARLEDTA